MAAGWLPLKWRVGLRNVFARRPAPHRPTGFAPFDEIAAHAVRRSDINEHLVPLFWQALAQAPRLIVELGVRGGESTYVFERAAALLGARLVSIDLADCSGASAFSGWNFIQADDVAFAPLFPAWCRARQIEPEIGLLFVDTSHEREHTRREIDAWLPMLAPYGLALFHDTNLRRPYWRRDGSWNLGWDNHRGVISALEEFLAASFDENREFIAVHRGWLVHHRPWCAGLTSLRRMSPPPEQSFSART